MLAIIDGDVLVYQSFYARKPPKGNQEEFVHLDGADESKKPAQVIMLDQKGHRVQEEQQQQESPYTKEEDAEYLQASYENFKRNLNSLVEKLYCDDYVMAVRGDECFRYVLFDDYKKNRQKQYGENRPQLVNEFVPTLRKLAVYEGYAIAAHGREADDLIRTWANEARRAGQEHIICSIDKDLRCIPGKHYIMHMDPEKQVILNISDEEARRHYYEQLLKGDPTDNIPGVPRVGEVKAKNLISECLTEKEMQEKVVGAYIGAFGDDWYNHFLINAKLIHLQNHFNDFFDCRHWPIIQELC